MRPCPNCRCTDYKLCYTESPFQVIKCKKCKLVFLGNPPDENTLYENYHETTELDFDEYSLASNSKHIAGLFAINRQRLKWILRTGKSGKLLDVGCGRGYFLKTMSDAGYDVAGMDVSMTAIEYVRKQFALQASNTTLDELVRGGEKYDVITMWHVLEHFIDPYDALNKIRQLLNDDGACFIEVPNLRSLKFLLAKQKWQGGNHPKYHRTFFSNRTLRAALLKAGFTKSQRVPISYRLPEGSGIFGLIKPGLNLMGMDSFLDFVVST